MEYTLPLQVVFLFVILAATNASLNGTKLKCCVLTSYPITYADPQKPKNFSGLAINYLSEMMEEKNFSCSSIEDVRLNKTESRWEDFVDVMEACHKGPQPKPSDYGFRNDFCKCDLGIGGWSFTTRRLGKVDFLPNYLPGDLRVITNIKNTESLVSGPFFITSFSPSVWIAIAGLVAVWTLLKMLDNRFVPPEDSFEPLGREHSRFHRIRHVLLKSNLFRRLRLSFMTTTSRLLGQGDDMVVHRVSSTRHWFLNTTIMLCGLFLVLAYEATMTANLVQDVRLSEYETLEDLRSCKIPPDQICVKSGAAQETFWNDSIASNHERNGCRGKVKTGPDDETVESMVYEGICKYAIVYSTSAISATTQKYCRKLIIVGKSFYENGVAMILPLNRPYKTELTNATLNLRQNQELETAEQYLSMKSSCELYNSTQLTFKRLELFFIVAYAACIIFFFEMIVDPQKERKADPFPGTGGGNENG